MGAGPGAHAGRVVTTAGGLVGLVGLAPAPAIKYDDLRLRLVTKTATQPVGRVAVFLAKKRLVPSGASLSNRFLFHKKTKTVTGWAGAILGAKRGTKCRCLRLLRKVSLNGALTFSQYLQYKITPESV